MAELAYKLHYRITFAGVRLQALSFESGAIVTPSQQERREHGAG